MKKTKIVLVGGMVNTLNAFRPLVDRLREVGHEVHLLEGTQRPQGVEAWEIEGLVSSADLVFSGMAAPASFAEFELAVLSTARVKGKQYGLLSDAAGAYRREWFGEYLKGASFVAVRFPHEVAEAGRLSGCGVVMAVGHPTAERAAFPKMSREEVRDLLGLSSNEIAVYVSGAKSIKTNKEVIKLVDSALDIFRTMSTAPTRFLFGPHPGVTGDRARKEGKEIPSDAYRSFSRRLEVVSQGVGRSEDLLIGMDAFLFTSGTTFYAAIYQGVSAVMLNKPEIMETRDTDLSFECVSGSVLVANSPDALAASLNVVMSPFGRKLLFENRAIYWKKPEVLGESVERMVTLLESVAEADIERSR